ncbi:hypothetical protein [Psychrobacillus sp. NPDC093180]|uniref:hypothetical protein n=1 Tax=Psychrobacillus sp. NPDC093180 TaxID=3364489 RepID=UPI003812D06A
MAKGNQIQLKATNSLVKAIKSAERATKLSAKATNCLGRATNFQIASKLLLRCLQSVVWEGVIGKGQLD